MKQFYPSPFCGKPTSEIHTFLRQLSGRYFTACLYLQRQGKHKESHIMWGKYAATRTITNALFPHSDDRGNYTFAYLIQKMDCQLEEFEHEQDRKYENKL